MKFKYIGTEPTKVRLDPREDKVEVKPGDVVETNFEVCLNTLKGCWFFKQVQRPKKNSMFKVLPDGKAKIEKAKKDEKVAEKAEENKEKAEKEKAELLATAKETHTKIRKEADAAMKTAEEKRMEAKKAPADKKKQAEELAKAAATEAHALQTEANKALAKVKELEKK